MNSNHIARHCMVAMHVQHKRGCIQRGEQHIHARRGYQRRTQGAKHTMAVAVSDNTFQRRGLTRILCGTDAAQCYRKLSRQRARECGRCRQQGGKDHGEEREQSGEPFAAAREHGVIIIPLRAIAQVQCCRYAYPALPVCAVPLWYVYRSPQRIASTRTNSP